MRLLTTSITSVFAISLAISGCTFASPGYQDGGQTADGYKVQYQDNTQQDQRYSQQSQIIDINGNWCFRDNKGHWNKNFMSMVDGGMYATPVGRRTSGGERMYRWTGDNSYADTAGSGVYQFFDANNAVWRGGNKTFYLKSCP
jgi:hypothetical protein